MRRRLALLLAIITALSLSGCGADSSGYTPTVDTVETEGQIEFNASARQITVVEVGPSVRSDVLSPCEISFEARQLSYQLIDAQNLLINGTAYQRVRGLETNFSVPGVPEALFAVWGSAAQIIDQVSNQIEIEIRGTSLVYRNNCSR